MRKAVVTVVVLAVLGGLFVVADRVAVTLAQNAVEREVAAEVGTDTTSADISADIAGFPFLTQVAGGEFDEIVLDLGDVDVDGWRLRGTELTATSVAATISSVIGGSGTVRAGHVEGNGVVTYESVAIATDVDGLELSAGPDDTLLVSAPVGSLLSQADVATTGVVAELLEDLANQSDDPVMLTGTATVDINAGVVHLATDELAPEDPDLMESAMLSVLERVARATDIELTIPELPYGLALASATPREDGIGIVLVGNDVALTP